MVPLKSWHRTCVHSVHDSKHAFSCMSWKKILYILGIPETSFKGRSTRMARSVRKSNDVEPEVVSVLANMVMNLDVKYNNEYRSDKFGDYL